MKQFIIEPKITGQYKDGRPKYNVEVPVEGEVLAVCEFINLSYPEVIIEMDKRAIRYNQQEDLTKYTPSEWINVGYFIHPPTIIKQPELRPHAEPVLDPLVGQVVSNPDFGKITAYYQVKVS